MLPLISCFLYVGAFNLNHSDKPDDDFVHFNEHKLIIINKLLTRNLILEKKYDKLNLLVKKLTR